MLAVNFRIELEFRTQLGDQLRVGMENEIHVRAGIEFARDVGKLALVHLLHLLDLGAFFLKFGFEAIDDVFDGVFFALRVEHEQRFVTILHDSGILLKVFIAESTPLSIAHFTASTARSIAFFTIGFSSSKKRPRT